MWRIGIICFSPGCIRAIPNGPPAVQVCTPLFMRPSACMPMPMHQKTIYSAWGAFATCSFAFASVASSAFHMYAGISVPLLFNFALIIWM